MQVCKRSGEQRCRVDDGVAEGRSSRRWLPGIESRYRWTKVCEVGFDSRLFRFTVTETRCVTKKEFQGSEKILRLGVFWVAEVQGCEFQGQRISGVQMVHCWKCCRTGTEI